MIKQLTQGFDQGVDKMRRLSQNFCDPLGITTFGYVRVYHNGTTSWLTTKPDQDRFLIESGALDQDPLLNHAESLKEGMYLWFNDRQFPGCETFYRDRSRLFQMDHGMVVVRHQKNYLETCCFSGLQAKLPLYNLFLNEKELFRSFMDNFTKKMDPGLLNILDQGVALDCLKSDYGKQSERNNDLFLIDRSSLITACGWKNLLKLSKRERECLVLLRKGYTYQTIGIQLKLSERTVEHYIDSVKNKLGMETRSELYLAAEKLSHLVHC